MASRYEKYVKVDRDRKYSGHGGHHAETLGLLRHKVNAESWRSYNFSTTWRRSLKDAEFLKIFVNSNVLDVYSSKQEVVPQRDT